VLSVRRIAKRSVEQTDALILRVSSTIASSLSSLLRNGRPYGLEVVGDPYEVFAPGVVRHPIRPLFRYWFTTELRKQCRRASAIAYVTERTLQQRYKPRPNAFTTHYSSVELAEEFFATKPKVVSPTNAIRVLSIGSMDQVYKGFDLLIAALAMCRQDCLSLHLTLVGDGRYRSELERLARVHGIADSVLFKGTLPSGRPIREELDCAHLFVLASKSEGLPRVMIEAMARGLPCIGSSVGGIPELLAADDLVTLEAGALAAKLREIVSSPERMNLMAARNLCKAREYQDSVLQVRRRQFFEHLNHETANWIASSVH
jgi:glycosyltransferase involved in cell wall biosynthesis